MHQRQFLCKLIKTEKVIKMLFRKYAYNKYIKEEKKMGGWLMSPKKITGGRLIRSKIDI